MIPVSDECAEIIRVGGFAHRWLADVYVDDERVMQDIALETCKLTATGNAKIRTQGECTLVYSDDLAESIVPSDITSWLAPYATFIDLSYEVALGGFSERILRGTFKIVGVSDPQESRLLFQNRIVTIGSRLTMKFADAFAVTDRERFLVPSSPESLASAWDEIGRITQLGLNRNVADAPIPRSTVYEESRLDAVFTLGTLLGGVPYVDPQGDVTIQPNAWPAESEGIAVGGGGRITKLDIDDLTDEGIYNQVAIRSHANDQTLILATAEVESGPLRYGGPFGRIPYFASSDFVTNPSQALAYAQQLLPVVSHIPAAAFQVEIVPDPRREVGDVVPIVREDETLVGRISELTLAGSGAMSLKVTVDRE